MYPDTQYAKITVYRKQQFAGGAIAYTVRIDGRPYPEKIRVDGRLEIVIIAGRHQIQMWNGIQGSKPLDFEVSAGRQIDFVCETATLAMVHPILIYRGDAPPPDSAGQRLNRFLANQARQSRQGQPEQPGPVVVPSGLWQAPDPSATAVSTPSSTPDPAAVPPTVLGYEETGQVEEPLGDEVRVIDNRGSNTGVTRGVRASREWSRNLSVGSDRTRTIGGEFGHDLKWLTAKGSIESELKRSYSMETDTKHVYEETLSIEAPARTAIRLVLHWKRIWQEGVVRVAYADGSTGEIPYRFVVNITFDQSQQDTDADPSAVI